MPGAAANALQEPEHELTVVQQVQQGSITSVGTKAQLTVKLPGEFGIIQWVFLLNGLTCYACNAHHSSRLHYQGAAAAAVAQLRFLWHINSVV
jgi:hypothetical protein